MSLKRKIAVTGGLIFLLSLLLVCLAAGAFFYLPHFLETRIIPQLAADAGISDFAVDLRNIGFYGADLSDLRLGPPKNPALVVRSVQVDYSPRSLAHKKIDKLTLSGIDLHAEWANGRFKLRGIDLDRIAAARAQPKKAPAPDDTAPAIGLARLIIRDSQIIIGYNGHFYRIPFEFDIVPQDPGYSRLDVTAVFYPRGEKITAAVKVDRSRQQAAVSIDAAVLNLDRFADLAGRTANLTLSGTMALEAKAQVRWAPLQIAAVNASLTLLEAKIKAGEIQLQNAPGADGKPVPFRIDLTGKGDAEWQFSGSRISMVAPLPMTVAGVDGTLKKNAATLTSSGNFNTVLHSSARTGQDRMPVKFQQPLSLGGRFSAIYHGSGRWQCEVSNQKSEDPAAGAVRLKVDSYTVTSSAPDFNLSASAKSGSIETAYRLKIPAARIASASESVNIPNLMVKGSARFANAPGTAATVTLDLQAPESVLKSEDGQIKISKFAVSGKLNRDDVRQITLEGLVQMSGAGGRFSRSGFRFGGARGKIPFRWPVQEKSARGSISVATLMYRGMELGRISSQIRQTAAGFAFEGRHHSELLPAMNLKFDGRSEIFTDAPAAVRLNFNAFRPADAPQIDLGKFFPEATGASLKGKIQLDGKLALGNTGFSGMVQTDFADGYLSMGQNSLVVEGMRMSINLPELPKMRSAPGQQLRFSKISLGDFVAQNGRLDFQVESARSVLIEKMHFKWCDGNVESQSMRLSPGIENYHITFYCDRLNLAKVLEQFGAAAARGQGSVNGRIPLQYTNGEVKFDDGFLFSTPGQGGKIYLSGTDILTAGIAPNTPQYVQMELAREALKDYDYSWAKLNITSEGETLLLQMQMDGKPAKTLPFVYKKDIGGFMKVEAGGKGSKFQGIRLDVNFRLPLNKLLQYKELINMIN